MRRLHHHVCSLALSPSRDRAVPCAMAAVFTAKGKNIDMHPI
jgi:hypothetical protein